MQLDRMGLRCMRIRFMRLGSGDLPGTSLICGGPLVYVRIIKGLFLGLIAYSSPDSFYMEVGVKMVIGVTCCVSQT